ncbi:MAG: hypothetical protein LC775_13655, partial [Acidobacteria bacterium]|nr:hypothetical protein [Acidobacteriota bacterium]
QGGDDEHRVVQLPDQLVERARRGAHAGTVAAPGAGCPPCGSTPCCAGSSPLRGSLGYDGTGRVAALLTRAKRDGCRPAVRVGGAGGQLDVERTTRIGYIDKIEKHIRLTVGAALPRSPARCGRRAPRRTSSACCPCW